MLHTQIYINITYFSNAKRNKLSDILPDDVAKSEFNGIQEIVIFCLQLYFQNIKMIHRSLRKNETYITGLYNSALKHNVIIVYAMLYPYIYYAKWTQMDFAIF